jgi:hypothetical protein
LLHRRRHQQAVKLCPPPPACLRDSLWHLLFWQPLLRGPGFYLVTLLVLGGALAASLATPPDKLWQLLRLAGVSPCSHRVLPTKCLCFYLHF